MKYIQVDFVGNLYTRYDSDINPTIPGDAIAVSDELFWQTIKETDGIWRVDGGEVHKVPFPPPTAEQIAASVLASNTAAFNERMTAANDAITALQDKIDADLASPGEEATLKAWKGYRVALRAIDLKVEPVTWPVAP